MTSGTLRPAGPRRRWRPPDARFRGRPLLSAALASALPLIGATGGADAQAPADTARAGAPDAARRGGACARPCPRAVAGRAELARRLERILADPGLDRAHAGLAVQVAETGETLFERSAQKRFTAASTVKLVTAAVALRRLGPGHRWTTRLVADGPVGDGVLRGDLWVVGGGDPGVTRRTLAGWSHALRAAGIRRVTGDVVGDGRAFPPPRWGSGWMWDDLHLGWAAGVTGLQMDEPAVRAWLTPGGTVGSPARVRPGDPDLGLPLETRIRTGPPGSELRLEYLPEAAGGREIRGWVPADADSVPLLLSPRHPTLHLLRRLEGVLADSSVAVDGRFRRPAEGEPAPGSGGTAPAGGAGGGNGAAAGARSGPDDRWSLASPSDSLGAVLRDVLAPSDNLAAEALLRTLGREEGRAGTAGEGLAVVRETLEGWGVDPGAVALADGSGLSRYDELAPVALVRVLRAMWRSPDREIFASALAAPGEDGTLEERFLGIPARDALRAKTGSLSSVRGLAGYVTDGDGETLIFALLLNGYDVPGEVAEGLRDLLVEQLSLYHRPVEPGWPGARGAPGGGRDDDGGP